MLTASENMEWAFSLFENATFYSFVDENHWTGFITRSSSSIVLL